MTGFQTARLAALLAAAVALNGCATFAGGGFGPQTPMAIISGDMTYQARIALPPDSVAVVTLLSPTDGKILAEQRRPLDGVQVPVSFFLQVPFANMKPGADYTLRTAIEHRGRTLWIGDPVDVSSGRAVTETGTVKLHAFQSEALSSSLDCGGQPARVATEREGRQDHIRLQLGDEKIELRPARSTFGGRYLGVDTPATEVWFKDDQARITLRNEVLPECLTTAADAAVKPLLGDEWTVDTVDDDRLDYTRLSLRFRADGSLSGQAGCNSFSTTYRIDGDKLEVGDTAATMMTCPDAVMAQEELFLEVLQDAESIEILDTGELALTDSEGRSIIAHR
ncbi:MAG TPA: META domain-containing protein [Fluviicoccus sp.]|nr:META domain-containing protein [Fluviicoccus sp.]